MDLTTIDTTDPAVNLAAPAARAVARPLAADMGETRARRFGRRPLLRGGVALGAGALAAGGVTRLAAAQDGATSAATATVGDATPAIVAAASAFLDTLTDDERDAVLFDFTDTAQRQRWSNFPEGLFERDGLMWGDISAATQEAWLGLMAATLSEDGYSRVLAEWEADDVLADMDADGSVTGGGPDGGGGQGGGPSGMAYGRQYYWVAVIGEPSETEPWQWQFGGHHVTVNATIQGPDVALTPSFIGVQPGVFTRADGTEVRPIGDITDTAFALVNALDADQRAAAIIGDQYVDLVLGPGQDGRTVDPEGIAGSDLGDEQRALLLQLVSHYGSLVNDEDATARLAELEADLDDTWFAWSGPTEVGSAAYFRASGPRVVIEYSPQGLGNDPANHIHGIYRDPTNDYGARFTGVTVA